MSQGTLGNLTKSEYLLELRKTQDPPTSLRVTDSLAICQDSETIVHRDPKAQADKETWRKEADMCSECASRHQRARIHAHICAFVHFPILELSERVTNEQN